MPRPTIPPPSCSRTLDELADPRFRLVRLRQERRPDRRDRAAACAADTGAVRLLPLTPDDLWNDDFLERHLAAHLNESYAVGFTACNARLIDGQARVIAGGRLLVSARTAPSPTAAGPSPPIDPGAGAHARSRRPSAPTGSEPDALPASTPSALVHWVWVSTSSMMFRRSLIDLVFPDDDEAFRLHMDFYVVVMAQMVAGSLLIDEPLYSYRLHGRNGAADNPGAGRPAAPVGPATGATPMPACSTACWPAGGLATAGARWPGAWASSQCRRMLASHAGSQPTDCMAFRARRLVELGQGTSACRLHFLPPGGKLQCQCHRHFPLFAK